MERRTFVAALSGAVAGFRPPSTVYRLPSVGVQLYTLRALMQRDLEGTLAAVAGIGYREVEFAGYFGRTPAQVRAALDANGLTAPATHVPVERLSDGFDRLLDECAVMGHRYVVVAWTPQEMRRTLDGWRRVADLFTRAGEQARRAGMRYAYHNHDFEFVPLEGRVPFDVLLEAADPEAVQIELDLFWIRKGGQDPLAYFARWPGRFPMVHLKDMAADGRMVDVGAGVIDWPGILGRHQQAGIRHYFAEHDNPADPLASVRASYQYLSRLSLP